MSTFLVTGATGFLGRHLVRGLVARGERVVALVRGDAADLDGAEIRRGDVLDRDSVARAAAGADGVFHCAGKVSRRAEDAEELRRLHVDGTKNVLDAAKGAGVPRAVVASTSGTVAVGEDPDRVYTEEDAAPIGLLNRWPYYRSKLFAEKAALERNTDGFEVISVNPTLLLGPGDINGSSTEDVRLFLERKVPAVPPGGLSYVDVRDAAEGMRLAMERGVAGRRYLLGACNLTIREFFARLERVSGVRAPALVMPRVRRGADLARAGAEMLERIAARVGVGAPLGADPISLDMAHFYWYLDATLAETELGWAPRDPTLTLADTVKDLEERGVVWPADLGVASAAGALLSSFESLTKRRAAGRPSGEDELCA